MRLSLSILLLSASFGSAFAEAPPVQQWIDEALQHGGGVVTIPPGVHVLEKGLLLKDAKKLALRGMDKEQCVLKLPPLAYAEAAADIPAGAAELPVRAARHWQPGMRLHIEADGAIDSFTKKPKPYVLAVIQEVKPDRFILKAPLEFPIPVASVIRHEDAPNLIEIRGACEEIEIANLTLDGGRIEGDPPVRGHAQLCGVFAAGAYSYEKGPTGPKPKGITVRDCIVQNFFGRGVAFYSVEAAAVERCSFRDIADEAIDFDHFVTNSSARGNHIIRCRVAFELNDANTTLIVGNEVRDSGLGLNLWRWCKQPGLNEGNVIRDNLFEEIAGNAMQIGAGTARNVIEGNEIVGAGRNGISLAGEAQVVRGNVIREVALKPLHISGSNHQIDDLESP
jgi:hypothetical protein